MSESPENDGTLTNEGWHLAVPPHQIKVAIRNRLHEITPIAIALSNFAEVMGGLTRGFSEGFFGSLTFTELDSLVAVLTSIGEYDTARAFVNGWSEAEEDEELLERRGDILELFTMIDLYERQG